MNEFSGPAPEQAADSRESQPDPIVEPSPPTIPPLVPVPGSVAPPSGPPAGTPVSLPPPGPPPPLPPSLPSSFPPAVPGPVSDSPNQEPAPVPAPTPAPPAAPARPARIPKEGDFPDTGPNALASLSQRAWARTFDGLFIYLPLVFTGFVFAFLAAGGSFDPNTPIVIDTETKPASTFELIPFWLILVLLALSVLYEVVAVAWKGQTIGKWVLGIRVARYGDGKKPTLEQSALRCLLPTAAGVATLALIDAVPAGAMIVFSSSFFYPLRRGWHDVAGGTVVVRTR